MSQIFMTCLKRQELYVVFYFITKNIACPKIFVFRFYLSGTRPREGESFQDPYFFKRLGVLKEANLTSKSVCVSEKCALGGVNSAFLCVL